VGWDLQREAIAARPLSESAILLSMKKRAQAPTESTREVKLSSNRQVGLPADFARALGVRPRDRLIGTLVRVPGVGYAVLLMPRPRSYAKALADSLAGIAPEGADAYVRELRSEWEKRT
jgi:bifunctional DNA-binding transcriptional regulator/antitoxin component of YhaV-PrlF toxin-antitoxin module